MTKLLPAICAFSLCLSGTGLAQAEQPPAASSEDLRISKVGVRFVCTSTTANTPAKLYMRTGAKRSSEVILQTRFPGLRIPIPEDRIITLMDAHITNPENPPKILCTQTIPEGVTQAVAMLSPTETGGLKMDILDENSYKPGAIHLVNPTPINLRIKIGDKPLMLNSRTTVHFSSDSPTAKNYPVQIWFENPESTGNDDKWKLYQATTWRIHPDTGVLGLINWNKTTKRPEINSITLFKDPEQPKEN